MERLIRICLLAASISVAALAGPAQAEAYKDPAWLEVLFAELKTTRDAARGQWLGHEIARRWLQSGDAAIDAQMARGQQLMRTGRLKAALDVFKRVVAQAPDYAEGWNKRAHVHFLRGEYRDAIASIERVLDLEPRHFLALAGLGLTYLRLGDGYAALRAFDKALAINPHLTGTRKEADRLRPIYGEKRI